MNAQFRRRIVNSLATSLTNIMPVAIAALLTESSGDSLTIFVVASLLATAYAQMQWERSGQLSQLTDVRLDLLSVAAAVAVYLAILGWHGSEYGFHSVVSLAVYVIAQNNIQVFASYCTAHASGATWWRLTVLRLLYPVVILLLAKSFARPDAALVEALAAALSLALLAIVVVTFRPDKRVVTPLLRSGLFFVSFDFLKNQSWLIFSAGFASSVALATVFLVRQLLGPVALLLAALRAANFDLELKASRDTSLLWRRPLAQYAIIIAVSLALFPLAAVAGGWVLNIYIIVLAWLLLLLAQDLRAYFSRTQTLSPRSAALMVSIATSPIVAVVLWNYLVAKLDLSSLIIASGVGEILLVVYFLSLRGTDAERV